MISLCPQLRICKYSEIQIQCGVRCVGGISLNNSTSGDQGRLFLTGQHCRGMCVLQPTLANLRERQEEKRSKGKGRGLGKTLWSNSPRSRWFITRALPGPGWTVQAEVPGAVLLLCSCGSGSLSWQLVSGHQSSARTLPSQPLGFIYLMLSVDTSGSILILTAYTR